MNGAAKQLAMEGKKSVLEPKQINGDNEASSGQKNTIDKYEQAGDGKSTEPSAQPETIDPQQTTQEETKDKSQNKSVPSQSHVFAAVRPTAAPTCLDNITINPSQPQ